MDHRITTSEEKKLIGRRIIMSISYDRTFELWRKFMPSRKLIRNCIGSELYAVQIYPPLFFQNFDPVTKFEKWAAVEVTSFDKMPDDFERLIIPGGLYAVFLYKGASSAAEPAFQYIFNSWLPDSGYLLDDRPHFEILGEKYKNEDPDSEEEIWIPVKLKED